jgi:predicted secreted Zn-dependent protease
MNFAAVFLASTLALTGLARADVTVLEDRIVWYDVSGASIHDLRKSLAANSPAKGFDAETKWWVDWRYRRDHDGEACTLTNVTVMLRLETTFPHLAREDGVPADVLQKWRDYSARMMAHERTHARNGAEAAEQIDRMLKAFSIAGACNDIEEKANAQAMKLIGQANKADEDYDRRTDHGGTEGAALQ